MDLFAETIRDQFEDLHQQGVRIRFVGRRDRVSEDLRTQMTAWRSGPRATGARPVWRSTTAGGRRSSRPAAPSCGRHRARGDRRRAAPHLGARAARPDLVIRTSGSTHLELPALAVGLRRIPVLARLWPDFGPDALATRSPSTRGAVVASAAVRAGLLNRILVAVPLAALAIAGRLPGRLVRGGVRGPGGRDLVHELSAMARTMRPMALAGQAGDDDRDRRSPRAGVEWVVAAVPITLLLAFCSPRRSR